MGVEEGVRVYVEVEERDKVEVGEGERKVVREGEMVDNVVAVVGAMKDCVVIMILLMLVVWE